MQYIIYILIYIDYLKKKRDINISPKRKMKTRLDNPAYMAV